MNLAKSENRISATPAATEPPTLSLTAQEVIRRAQNGDAAVEYLYGVHMAIYPLVDDVPTKDIIREVQFGSRISYLRRVSY
jgi:hypothetical protein